MEKPKEEPKEEPKKDVKFVYYIDGHQVFVDELWFRGLTSAELSIFVKGVRAGLRATPIPPGDEEVVLPGTLVELVLPALPGSCPGMDSGKTERSDPSQSSESDEPVTKKPAMSESRKRPLSSSSSAVDSDEFYMDQTPKPPKPAKKPAAKIKPAGKAKGVKG
ncbi:unnamed protein product [Symbiodinium microadriaticum]|nr:unnamed protein product [Symbiodinium microadriaticum]